MAQIAQPLSAPERAHRRTQAATGGWWRLLLATLRQWRRRLRSRRELRELDEPLLRDIGISRSVAQYEGGKPFWRD